MAHTLVEDIQHGIVFVESDFQSGIGTEGDITEDDAQSDGDEQQWFEVLLDGEPDEKGSHRDHDEISDGGVSERRIGQKLFKILYDKLS